MILTTLMGLYCKTNRVIRAMRWTPNRALVHGNNPLALRCTVRIPSPAHGTRQRAHTAPVQAALTVFTSDVRLDQGGNKPCTGTYPHRVHVGHCARAVPRPAGHPHHLQVHYTVCVVVPAYSTTYKHRHSYKPSGSNSYGEDLGLEEVRQLGSQDMQQGDITVRLYTG